MPEPHELIGFFGSEPVLTDEGLPWAYNRVTFSTRVGDDQVIFEMEPGSGLVRLFWQQDDQKRLELLLDSVESLTIDDREDNLVLRFTDRLAVGPLRLRLAPRPTLFWDAQSN
jgi:hypothetical protein